jgi:hypothetical protein
MCLTGDTIGSYRYSIKTHVVRTRRLTRLPRCTLSGIQKFPDGCCSKEGSDGFAPYSPCIHRVRSLPCSARSSWHIGHSCKRLCPQSSCPRKCPLGRLHKLDRQRLHNTGRSCWHTSHCHTPLLVLQRPPVAMSEPTTLSALPTPVSFFKAIVRHSVK